MNETKRYAHSPGVRHWALWPSTRTLPPVPLHAELVEFLKEPHAAVIATVRSDGAPYTAATWYDWDGGRILVNMDFERLTHMRRPARE